MMKLSKPVQASATVDLRLLTCVVSAALALAASQASATLIASDSFAVGSEANDYNDASGLYGQNASFGVSGFTGSWTAGSSTGDLRSQAGGLTASLVTGTALPGHAIARASGSDRAVYHTLSSMPASSVYYFSFLLNSQSTSNIAAMGLTSNSNYDPLGGPAGAEGVLVGAGGTNLKLWVDGSASTLLANYSTSATYVVVVEILNNLTSNDTITAKVFSSTATDLKSPLGSVTATGEISDNLTKLGLIKDNSTGDTTGLKADEFRLGTTIGDVVVPEPATLTLLGVALPLLLRRKQS